MCQAWGLLEIMESNFLDGGTFQRSTFGLIIKEKHEHRGRDVGTILLSALPLAKMFVSYTSNTTCTCLLWSRIILRDHHSPCIGSLFLLWASKTSFSARKKASGIASCLFRLFRFSSSPRGPAAEARPSALITTLSAFEGLSSVSIKIQPYS